MKIEDDWMLLYWRVDKVTSFLAIVIRLLINLVV